MTNIFTYLEKEQYKNDEKIGIYSDERQMLIYLFCSNVNEGCVIYYSFVNCTLEGEIHYPNFGCAPDECNHVSTFSYTKADVETLKSM